MSKRGFSLIELMVVVAIIGLLASIAMPSFMKFQARAKQSEAKATLRAAYTAQKAYFQEKDNFSSCIRKIGFNPERGNRYKYEFGTTRLTAEANCNTAETRASGAGVSSNTDSSVLVDTFKYGSVTASPPAAVVYAPSSPANSNIIVLADLVGVTPLAGGSHSSFGVSASGNIDHDSIADLWYVSSVSSSTNGICPTLLAGSRNVPAGEPMNTLNDVICQ